MQRMSRAQRILLIYILWKLHVQRKVEKPKHPFLGLGGGVTVHGNEFHSPNFYSSEADIPVLSDAKYPNALLLSGLRPMEADLDMNDHDIDLGDTSAAFQYIKGRSVSLKFHPTANYFYVRNRADTADANFVGGICFFNTIAPTATNNQFRTANDAVSNWLFVAGTPLTECAKLVNREFGISRAGDITLLAGKVLSGLGDVRAPNLPVADPADGLSKLWNNTGVVTVGT